METGRELDILVAEKVMGHKVVHTTWNKGKSHSYTIGEPDYYDEAGDMKLWNPVPNYSEDIKDAWEVVDKLKTVNSEIYHLSRALRLTLSYVGSKSNKWRAEFDLENDNAGDDTTYWYAEAETPELAICNAALKTLED